MEAAGNAGFTVVAEGGQAWIDSSPLLDIESGDEFALVDATSADPVGTARVVRIEGDRAILSIQTDGRPLPESTRAIVTSLRLGRLGVRIEARSDAGGELEALVKASPHLEVRPDAAVEVRRVGDDLVLVELPDGGAFDAPIPDGPAGRSKVVKRLEARSAADRMRTLAAPSGSRRLETPVRLDVRAVREGVPVEGGRGPLQLVVGDAIQVLATNFGTRPIWAWLFDIGVDDRVTLLTPGSGHRIEAAAMPGSNVILYGRKGPRRLAWGEIPRDRPRQEQLLAIFSERPQDLSPLETSRRGADGTPLDLLLDSVRSGVRNLGAEEDSTPASAYRLERFVFDLVPVAGTDEPDFEVDDRPSVAMRSVVGRGAGSTPGRIALRLTDVVIRANRALFRAPVRIDSLVLTRTSGTHGIASAATLRFESVGDRERLPLDDALLYLGPVLDVLEVAIWVSRDDRAKPPLDELLGARLTDPEITAALTTLGGLVLAAPQAIAIVGVVAATATVVRAAASLVRAATGTEIGTYRTSYLAQEQFGLGRHPSMGLRQARDVEFALEVVDVT